MFDEIENIKNIKKNMPTDTHLITFNRRYNGWLLGYSGLTIDLLDTKIKQPITKEEKIIMRDNPEHLCDFLREKNQTTYIYV